MKKILPGFLIPKLALVILSMISLAFGTYAQTVILNPANPWLVPAGVSSIKVEVWGGGGAGGGCNSALGASFGSGGGGGAYNQATLPVSPGQSYTIVRGSGGGGVSDNTGGNGTVSSVSGPGGSVSANFGVGGQRRGGLAGAGGAAVAGGLAGGKGGVATANGAGGGGAAGNAGAGGDGSDTQPGAAGLGNPNAAPYAGGLGAAAKTGSGNGNSAVTGPGGGGSGGKQNGFFAGAKAGGAGAPGQVVITYCITYSLLTTAAQTPVCTSSASAAISLTADYLPTGTYNVIYDRSSPAATGLTATMVVTVAGSGSFNVPGLTIPGSSTITITSLGSASSTFCTNAITANNTATVSVEEAASVSAGPDQTLCASAATINLAGNFGGAATGIVWAGAGTFNPDNTVPNAIYTPTAAEVAAGTATLNITTDDPAGVCIAATDQVVFTIKASPAALNILPASGTICTGNSILLTGTANVTSSATLATENFNTNGSYSYTTAGSNSGGGTAFSQQSNNYLAGVTVITNNDGSRFMIATASNFGNASTNSTLTSPVINTAPYQSLILSFRHSYAKGSEAGVSVQVSTDPGNTVWSNINTSGTVTGSNTYTSNQGANNNFVNATINLTPYINFPDFRLRFNFISNVLVATSWWAIDDVAVNGVPLPLIAWSANTAAAVNGLPAGAGTAGYANKNISVSPTATTTYSFTAKDPVTNCVTASGTSTIQVTANGTIALSSTPGSDVQVVCNQSTITDITYTVGGSATNATVTGLPGGLTGVYNAGVFTISGSPTETGSFDFTVSTVGPCIQSGASGTIYVLELPSGTYTYTNVSACNATNDGSITLNATGGVTPYSYSWTGVVGSGNPATTPFTAGDVSALTGLQIGYYNVAITDGNGCTGNITGIHIQYAFSAYITNNGSISSSCGNTGSITLYANAGVQPYSFSLDGVTYQASNSFTGLPAATYTAYIKDGAGCVSTKVITVGAAAPVTVNAFVRPASSCASDGVIEIYRTGGIPPYSYSLDGVTYQLSNNFSSLSAGPYTAYVKDSKGCIGTQSVTVQQGAALLVNYSKQNTSTCINDGTIQVNGSGGLPPYKYSLNAGAWQSSNTFTGLGAATYIIGVQDVKGCEGSANVTINLNPITVTSAVINASGCAAPDGKIQLFRTGGYGPYTYSLDGNTYQSATTFTNLPAGTYDGFVKDSKACVGMLAGIVVGPACGGFSKPGNLIVHELPAAEEAFTVVAYPNPTEDQFMLRINTAPDNLKTTIIVTDQLGRKVYEALSANKTPRPFGKDFKAGIYYVQVLHGNESQVLKLVKR